MLGVKIFRFCTHAGRPILKLTDLPTKHARPMWTALVGSGQVRRHSHHRARSMSGIPDGFSCGPGVYKGSGPLIAHRAYRCRAAFASVLRRFFTAKRRHFRYFLKLRENLGMILRQIPHNLGVA